MTRLTPLDDSASFGLWLIALLIVVYLSTFVDLTNALLIPAFLLIGGLIIQIAIVGKLEHDVSLSDTEVSQTARYTFLAFAGILVGSIVLPSLFIPALPAAVTPGTTDAALYTTLFAIAEERFFRGGINTFLQWKLSNPMLAVMVGALVFAAYHLAVFGTNFNSLAYVLFAGFLFGYVTYKTGRLTAATLAHVLNNLIAVFMGGA